MTGNPQPTVRWVKNGEAVIPSDYFQIVVRNIASVFRIKRTFVLFTWIRIYITFSHLADAFIQSDLQMKTIEANQNQQKSNNMCYNNLSYLNSVHVELIY